MVELEGGDQLAVKKVVAPTTITREIERARLSEVQREILGELGVSIDVSPTLRVSNDQELQAGGARLEVEWTTDLLGRDRVKTELMTQGDWTRLEEEGDVEFEDTKQYGEKASGQDNDGTEARIRTFWQKPGDGYARMKRMEVRLQTDADGDPDCVVEFNGENGRVTRVMLDDELVDNVSRQTGLTADHLKTRAQRRYPEAHDGGLYSFQPDQLYEADRRIRPGQSFLKIVGNRLGFLDRLSSPIDPNETLKRFIENPPPMTDHTPPVVGATLVPRPSHLPP